MFDNRVDAGRQLANKVETELKYRDDLVVLALPRGGVPVAAEVSKRLDSPLDIIVTRKIGHPQNPEYAIGAVGGSSEPVLNPVETREIDPDWLEREVEAERREIERREAEYAPENRAEIAGQNVVLVDDGVATGYTMKAAISEAKAKGAKHVIVAVPVTPQDTLKELENLADQVIAVHAPKLFMGAIGSYYRDFAQTSDEEVRGLL